MASYWGYTPQQYTVSGTVTAGGSPVPAATVTLSGLVTGYGESAATNGSGGFSFAGVPGGVPYLLSAEHPDPGYTCIPFSHNIANLIESGTYNFVCSSSDRFSPEAVIIDAPSEYVADTSFVSFQWTGTDNVTPSNLLEFQYRLLGASNEAWSPWSNATDVNYDLSNGVYAFDLNARDEAGNVSLSSARYTFAVASAPRVASSEPLDQGIWFGALEVTCPSDATTSCDDVVILPEQFGLFGDDFAPVRLFSSVGDGAIGTIDYTVEELGLPGVFADAPIGFNLTLSAPLAPDESVDYTIQWGKLPHLGWGENVAIPAFNHLTCVGDGAQVEQFAHSPHLDAFERYCRLESKNAYHIFPSCDPATRDAYLFLHCFGGSSEPESIREIAFQAASFYPEPDDPNPSYYGTSWRFQALGNGLAETPTELWVFWNATEYTHDPLNNPPILDRDLRGFAFQRFNKYTMNPIGDPFTSELIEDDWWNAVARAADGHMWLLGETDDDRLVYSKISPSGQILQHRVTVATHPGNLTDPHFQAKYLAAGDDGKLWFFYSRSWDASPTNDRDRAELYAKVLNPDGTTACPEWRIGPPAADPSVNYNNDRFFSWSPVINQDGKAWTSYGARINGELFFYYSIFNPDCTPFVDNVSLNQQQQFRFADSDGYVWMTEPGQTILFDANDNKVHAPWAGGALIPNQSLGTRAALVQLDRYRIFDRWSTQALDVIVPPSTSVSTMELINADKFNQDARVEDVIISTPVLQCESVPGLLPPVTEFDVSVCLSVLPSVTYFTQSGLLGGELLVTFPLTVCESDADCDDDDVCNGTETCDIPTGTCQTGTALNCDDGVFCTLDSCDPGVGCSNTASSALCDNGQFCDGSEICDPVQGCQAGAPPVIDDFVACTEDSCDEVNDMVVNIPNDVICDNGQFCDGEESCDPQDPNADPNGCVAGTAPDCSVVNNDGIACTDDTCDPLANTGAGSCVNVPNHTSCDDGLFCNGVEVCGAIGCESLGDPCVVLGLACDEDIDGCVCEEDADCDDGNPCTDDSCPDLLCVHTDNDTASCDDGLFCNGEEVCSAGVCLSSGDPCSNVTAACDDGVDGCVCGNEADCDDDNPCTDDACPAEVCIHTDNTASCDDGMFCNGAETCEGGECEPGFDPCPGQQCNEADDVCFTPPGGGGGGGGETPPEPDAPTESGEVGDDGHVVVEVVSDDGSTRGGVEVTGGTPGADVTLTLRMNDGEPGLPRAAKFGFADERVLGSTLEVTSTLVPGTFAATVQLVVQQDAVESLGLELAEVDLHVKDGVFESSDWARAGRKFWGNSPPSQDEGDYGYNIHDDGTVSYWAVVDRFSAFAVGQSEDGPSTCDDGVFCNGQEATDVFGRCGSGAPPCDLSECCDEAAGFCFPAGSCSSDDDCDNGTFCDGAEVCVGGCCQTGSMPCASGDCCEDTDSCERCPCVTDADCPDNLCCDTPSRACVECPCLSDSDCP